MKSLHGQAGKSFFGILINIALIGGALAFGMKMLPVYLEFNSVNTIMEAVSKEKSISSYNPRQVWRLVKKRLDVNAIKNVKFEDLSVERGQGFSRISIKYEVRKPFVGNMDIVAKYDNTIEVIGGSE